MVNATSALRKEIEIQGGGLTYESPKLEINDLVKAAGRVIAPLWPISTFAACNPWMGLEDQSFEKTAHWLKVSHNVDIYPSATIIKSAKRRGEINEDFLEMGLQRWLDIAAIHIPRETAEKFCREALKLESLPLSLLESPEVKNAAKKLGRLKGKEIKGESIQPISIKVKQDGAGQVSTTLDHYVIKWCKLFLNESQSAWTLPNREEGFYRAWRKLVQYDPSLSRIERRQFKKWPEEAGAALEKALTALKIPESKIQDYLEAHLLALPGWAGMMLWRSQQTQHDSTLLTEYLAVRISMEWSLVKPYLPNIQEFEKKDQILPLIAAWLYWGGMSVESWSWLSPKDQKQYLELAHQFNEIVRRNIWLEAWERTYEAQLRMKITTNKISRVKVGTALAQFVFCIDVRSEPFRRQLEKLGPYETYGMAGFFGLPVETSELGSDHTHASLPVILKPQHKVKEIAAESDLKNYQERRTVLSLLRNTFKSMKQNMLASLLLPEVSGPLLSFQMIGRTFMPYKAGNSFRQLHESWLRKPSIELLLDHQDSSEELLGFSLEEKVQYARQALQLMGLTDHFASLVVVCGHGSHSTNNPYASALHCGACGGASGKFNARILATLCNIPEVRETLQKEGISIPENTVFAAAEHITSLDELRWVYVPKLTEEAKEAFNRIEEVLPKVSYEANRERLSQLPNLDFHNKDSKKEAQRLSEDWSEIRPEWGLARNASFIIGRRELTKGSHLEGRSFLHNYDWRKDPDGAILANIIAGPGTVTQWINLQYYASTVAPHFYGSGNKATQTVTAGLGVMQGNASDLLTGLPWQSVMKSDDEAYHSPLRLLIVIEAPRSYVQRLLDHNPAFRQKVENRWLRLATIDPDGCWENW